MSTIADIIRQLQMQEQMGNQGQTGLPSLTGNNQYGFRDLAAALLGSDIDRQQAALDKAIAGKDTYMGKLDAAISGGAAELRSSAYGGTDEIRSMVGAAQEDFDAESARIRRQSQDRYLADTASQLAGAGSNLGAQIRSIDSDPMLTPAQKAQLKTEARAATGQVATAAISAEAQAHQDRTLATDMNLLGQEVGLRQSNIGQMQQALQRQDAALQAASALETQGYTNMAQLAAIPDPVMSLFGSLANLAAFEQNTRLPVNYELSSSLTDVPGAPGRLMTRIPTYSWGVTPGTGIGGY